MKAKPGRPLILALVLACSCAGAAFGDERASLVHEGRERGYLLVEPERADGDAPPPLVIVLHGGGGTGESMRALSGFDAQPRARGWAVAYPDGLSGAWNSARVPGSLEPRRRSPADDVGFLETLIDALAEAGRVDREAVFLAGYSRGSMMAHRFACERAGQLAGVALVQGSQNAGNECAPGRPVPALLMHGDSDPILPFEGGTASVGGGELIAFADTAALWARANGCKGWIPAERREDAAGGTRVVVDDGEACARPVRRVVVEGGGHGWPGGAVDFPPAVYGGQTRALDASAEIAAFFEAIARE